MPGFIYRLECLTPLFSMPLIVGTLICFKVQLSVHEFALIKKEDVVYPLVDIDSVFKQMFSLSN